MYHSEKCPIQMYRDKVNIQYRIKGTVLLQDRNTANFSGLLHSNFQRLNPLLDFTQLCLAGRKVCLQFCQLM